MRNADMNYHAELGQFQADLLALSLPAYGGLEAPWCRRLSRSWDSGRSPRGGAHEQTLYAKSSNYIAFLTAQFRPHPHPRGERRHGLSGK